VAQGEPSSAAQAPLEIGHGHRLAWIMGSSRSGSTWLLRMLADTGEVAAIDDPHIGHHLGVWRPIPLAWAAADEVPDLTTLTEVKRDKPDYFFSDRYRSTWMPGLRQLIAARFAAQARAEGARGDSTIVVKEPGSHAAEILFGLFPDSRLVFLLRDGRDVVDSWVDAYHGGSWAQEEGAFQVAAHGRVALVRWLASVWLFRTEAVERAYAGLPRDHRVLVRYEDLLRHPVAELSRISDMLELGVNRRALAGIAAGRDFAQVARGERGDGNFVRAANPGRWRQNLTPWERSAMLEIIGPKLEQLGYFDGPSRGRGGVRAA
jgi:hypothetical protein